MKIIEATIKYAGLRISTAKVRFYMECLRKKNPIEWIEMRAKLMQDVAQMLDEQNETDIRVYDEYMKMFGVIR